MKGLHQFILSVNRLYLQSAISILVVGCLWACGSKDPVTTAEAMIENKRHTEAITLLKPLVQADESNADMMRLLGDAYYERARDGRNMYQIFDLSTQDFEDFKQAVILYEKSQKLDYQEGVKRRRITIMTVIGPRLDHSM